MEYNKEKGDLFQIDRNKWVLAHCISADVTSTENMNRGIAKLFRKEYPDMAEIIAPDLKIGKAIRYQREGNVIYNLVTKDKVWQKAKGDYKDQYYKNLESCLIDLKNQMIKNTESFLAMPKIASGLDGGDWEYIKILIQEIFQESEIKIEIRYLEEIHKISNIIYLIEPAKSNRSQCNECNKNIEKGTLRLKESIPTAKYSKNNYYCKNCAEKILRKMKKEINYLIKELNPNKVD